MELNSPAIEDLRAALRRVIETWSSAADLPIVIDEASFELKKRDPYLRSLGPSCCIGRSPFVQEGKGVGGWILPENAADILSRGILKLPAPPAHVRVSLGGPVDQGIQVLQALYLESWNAGIDPQWRLDDDIAQRISERLTSMGTREVSGALYPWVFGGGIEIDRKYFPLAVAISPAMCVAPDQSYEPSGEVSPWGGDSRAPVAFVDPTGEVARWLMEQIREGRLTASRTTKPGSVSATVTIGGTPGLAPVETLTLGLPRG